MYDPFDQTFLKNPSSEKMLMITVVEMFKPSSAKDTVVQSTRTQTFLKKHLNPVILVFIG